MTVQDFKGYILKHMTADEALTKLLEGPLLQYEKLKFDKHEQPVHPVMIMSMAAMDMGWNFLLEDERISAEVRGMVVGTDAFLESFSKRILEILDKKK